MERADKLIFKEAPPDTSTYLNGGPAEKAKAQDAEGVEPFPFANTIAEESLNE